MMLAVEEAHRSGRQGEISSPFQLRSPQENVAQNLVLEQHHRSPPLAHVTPPLDRIGDKLRAFTTARQGKARQAGNQFRR